MPRSPLTLQQMAFPRPSASEVLAHLETFVPSFNSDLPIISLDVSPEPLRWFRGELVGKGSMGSVYVAVNADSGRLLVVKQIEVPSLAANRDSGEHRMRKAEMANALRTRTEKFRGVDHSNVVRFIGSENAPSSQRIFLDYISGGTIATCVRAYGKFSENVTKFFARQVLDGLAHLHERGIVHKAIRSHNILVERSGNCKISDGYSHCEAAVAPLDPAFNSMLSTVFVGSSIVKSKPTRAPTKVDDVWAVGYIVMEMWTGRKPWGDADSFAAMMQLAGNAPPPLDMGIMLSPGAEEFRLRCLATDPIKRQNATDLRNHPYLHLPADWTFTGNFTCS